MSEHRGITGFSFCMLLGLLFIALKLCGQVDWSWYWVLLPIYAPVLFYLAVLAVCLLLIGLATYLQQRS